MFALELIGPPEATDAVLPLGAQPVHLGRAATNEVSLTDPTVSSRHLAVWVSSGEVWIEDLRSRNGTFVNDRRIQGSAPVKPGDVLRLGERLRLRVRRTSASARCDVALALEDLRTGERHPLTTDRFRMGGGEVELALEGAQDVLAVLMIHDTDEAWLCEGDQAREVALDEPFRVFGKPFVLRCVQCAEATEAMLQPTSYPYRLEAAEADTRDAPITLRDLDAGLTHCVTGPEEAALLRFLGRRRQRDLASGMSSDDAGWEDDREVKHAVWGMDGATVPLSKLNALLCRVRKLLRAAGFDPLFLEKRRGALRARVAEVDVAR